MRSGILSRRCGLAIAGVVIASGADHALAQQANTVTLEPVTVESSATSPVPGYVARLSSTGTKSNATLLENPQAVTVVTRDQFEAQGARSVAEALRYEAGIVSETRIGDRFDNVFMRGFGGFGGNANYLHFWDNLRLPRGANYANPSIDPYLLDRIEILRGPASILYGQNNPGGIVNLISKRPTETPLREVITRVGDHSRIEAGFDFSGPVDKDGKLLYRLIGLGRTAENEVYDNRSERRLFAPSITWRPDLGTTLTVNASYDYTPFSFQSNWVPALGSLQPNPNGQIPRSFFSGHPDFNTFNRKQTSVGYEFEHRFNETWTARQNFRYMHIDSDFRAVSVSGTGYAAAGLCGGIANLCMTRVPTYFVEKLDAITVDNQIEAKLATGPLQHTVLAGLDYQWSSAGALSNTFGGPGTGAVPVVNYLNPVYGAVTTVPTLGVDTQQKRRQLGVYTQDLMRLGNWAFAAGVRYDRSDWSTASRNVSGAPLFGVAPGDIRNAASPVDSAVTWRAGATYLFDNGLAPYINYSTSFEPTLGADFTGAVFRPTTGKQIEAGLKYQPTWFNGYFLVSAFDLRQQNVTLQDSAHPGNANPKCTASAGFCQMQVGEIRSRGIELSGKATVVPGFDIVASYSYTNIEITEGPAVAGGTLRGKVPVGAPSHTAALWGDYTFQNGPAEGFGFGAGVRYVGSSYGDDLNTDAMRVPAYTLVDAALHYDLSSLGREFKGWKIALNVNNVFDKTYVSGCASTIQCFYGPGRSVLGSMRFRW